MSKFIIKGGNSLSGDVDLRGNKNAALPIISATVMVDGKVTLRNVPNISDVKVLLRILKSLGSKIRYADKGKTLTIDNTGIDSVAMDKDLVGKFRGSVLLMGPMLARFKKITTWLPGGCNLGQRQIDSHIIGFQNMGAKVIMNDWIELDGANMKGKFMWLDEASVTGTENLIMAAVLTKGETVIYNAASEPHVQDLCNFLNEVGADIKGIGSNRLVINGVEALHGGEWEIIADHMEIGTFISIAMMTDGEIRIKNALKEYMNRTLFDFEKLGLKYKWDNEDLIVLKQGKYVVKNLLGGGMNKIDCNIWPAFPADLLQFMVVNATKTSGQILIHDKMYEGRLFFYDQLRQMGANIIMCDPHRLIVTGHTPLKGTKLIAPDIRAGMSLVVAGLSARGVSEIDNIEVVDRGYEDLENRLSALGADISRE